ncbi:unnamed protein product [Dibothriocephalus latus]|uniref:BPTI/Kunitz inhibitor domain-containing protein n=1 Tax=Dibothriocephalus latus TaxID=60516 RepID=A0A3P6RD94_DIBLA|nr:unnamed protein product [Dibothriocephalus latus]
MTDYGVVCADYKYGLYSRNQCGSPSTKMIAVLFLAALVFVGSSEGARGPCDFPIDPGMCMAYFPSYGYNSETRRCEEFVYGGCGGNENRFDSLDECRSMCEHRRIRGLF